MVKSKLNSTLSTIFLLGDKKQASDILVTAEESVYLRIAGELEEQGIKLTGQDLSEVVGELVGESGIRKIEDEGSLDGAIGCEINQTFFRFRYNIFLKDSAYSIAFRRLDDEFRSLNQLGLPESLHSICEAKDGLFLVAGPTGSGKSTTLATILNRLNQTRPAHIITIEDPVEYVHRSSKSRVTQRQVGVDTPTFRRAIRDALRQDPDILLVGELRDLDSIRFAIEVAQTGHLVLATVHAGDSISAIERIVNVFPGDEQAMIQQLLSTSLRAILTQHLLTSDLDVPGRMLASELLIMNSASKNLVRKGSFAQIRSVMEMGTGEGMYTLDHSLAQLVAEKKISPSLARTLSKEPNRLLERPRVI